MKPLGLNTLVAAALLGQALVPWGAMAQVPTLGPTPSAARPAGPAVQVTDAWVRATTAQQKATGLYAKFTSAPGGQLVQAASPVADLVQVHEMVMDGNVMRMRHLPALNLPAGQAVELKPGGLHIMLMDLKKPLAVGDTVPLTLTIVLANGQRETVPVQARVLPLNSAGHAGQVDEQRHHGHGSTSGTGGTGGHAGHKH